jgi:hypothetical protein
VTWRRFILPATSLTVSYLSQARACTAQEHAVTAAVDGSSDGFCVQGQHFVYHSAIIILLLDFVVFVPYNYVGFALLKDMSSSSDKITECFNFSMITSSEASF